MKFSEWINKTFLQWQMELGEVQTQKSFAEYLGVPKQSLSDWMNGKYPPKSKKHVDAVGAVYPEVYDILELPVSNQVPVDNLPPQLVEAITEINTEFKKQGISDPGSEAALSIALGILKRVFPDNSVSIDDIRKV